MQSLRQWVWRTSAALTGTLAMTSATLLGSVVPAQAAGTVPAYDHTSRPILHGVASTTPHHRRLERGKADPTPVVAGGTAGRRRSLLTAPVAAGTRKNVNAFLQTERWKDAQFLQHAVCSPRTAPKSWVENSVFYCVWHIFAALPAHDGNNPDDDEHQPPVVTRCSGAENHRVAGVIMGSTLLVLPHRLTAASARTAPSAAVL
ncbi:hypothetical protein [Gandjariella thermophila]|uniref:Uncharacterized protein n=1 Tax=Gandjariella thermophila TaxID=1931992 RepID=A0A4D4JGU8_9PSEU|nr:hypothetical protein [Gandjariella thermophila]GDY33626.1 hypothetical protein GTS_52590 [Gandjariella thermophila]